ncbi:MAG: hypothetical protein ACPL4K_05605 [Candidatus Margulisiibacteriota bacterium]
MLKFSCPICEGAIEIADEAKEKMRVTCPHCFAQLQWYKHKGKFVLGCALCGEPVFDPDRCADCERRREKKSLLEEGRL